jgi:hypothetical protein
MGFECIWTMLKPQRHAIPPVPARASNAGHQYWDPTLPGALSMSNEQLNTSIWGPEQLDLPSGASGVEDGGSNWSNSKFGGDLVTFELVSGVSCSIPWNIPVTYSRDIPIVGESPWQKSPSHSRSPPVCRSQALSRSSRSPRRKPPKSFDDSHKQCGQEWENGKIMLGK